MNAIKQLKSDHRAVEALFMRFEAASSRAAKERIAQEICVALMVHATLEEELFYPSAVGAADQDLLLNAHVEHDSAKILIAEILHGGASDRFFEAKVRVLAEEIEAHVQVEEKTIFPQAKRSDLDLNALGRAMDVRRQELMSAYKRDGIPAPQTRTLAGPRIRLGQPIAI